MKKIIAHIDIWGNVTFRTEGFEGSVCQEATKQLEINLGRKDKDDPTDEFYVSNPQEHNHSN